MTRWLRRVWLRTYSERQLRECRAGVLVDKGELLSGVYDGRAVPVLTVAEVIAQDKLSDRLEDVDRELDRRGLSPWR